MNSEVYGSDRGVLMDGLRNTTMHDSRQPDSCSRFEPESCQVSGSGHCSTAAFAIWNATRVTRCSVRKRRVTHISCMQLTLRKLCTTNVATTSATVSSGEECKQLNSFFEYTVNDWWYTNPTELDAVHMFIASHTTSNTWTQDTLWTARSFQGSVHLRNT
jgi:hypothetical protein